MVGVQRRAGGRNTVNLHNRIESRDRVTPDHPPFTTPLPNLHNRIESYASEFEALFGVKPGIYTIELKDDIFISFLNERITRNLHNRIEGRESRLMRMGCLLLL